MMHCTRTPGAVAGTVSKLAHEFGLDESKFRACLADPAREQFVMRDTAEALRLGINGTPSSYLEESRAMSCRWRTVPRRPQLRSFAQIIDKLLKPENAGAIQEQKNTHSAPPCRPR